MKDTQYYVIQGWMINQLKLKGNELTCYAIIYGFTQDQETEFTGSAGYLANAMACTRECTTKTLKTLVEKNYIIKTDDTRSTKKPTYKINVAILNNIDKNFNIGVKNFNIGCEKNSQDECEKFSHNNIDIDNIDKNIDNTLSSKPDDFDTRVVNLWNNIAKKYKLAQVIRLSKERQTAVKARMKEYHFAEPEELFEKIRIALKESMHLRGLELIDTPSGPEIRNKPWRAHFDFFICQPSSLLKALEGAYADPDLVKR